MDLITGSVCHSAARRYPGQWISLSVLLVLVGFWPWLRLGESGPGPLAWLPVVALAVSAVLPPVIWLALRGVFLRRRDAQDPAARP